MSPRESRLRSVHYLTMNLTKKLTHALGVLAAAGAIQAQTTIPSPAANPSGLLGQRYAEISIGQFNPHGIDDNGFVGDARVNLPITSNIDAGFSYNYTRADLEFAGPLRLRTRGHTLGASSKFYSSFGDLRPFAGGAIGYQWSRDRFSGPRFRTFEDRDDDAIWALGIGMEIPLGTFALTPAITYQDGFDSDSTGGFTYGAEAHMWFTRTLGGFVDATYSDPTGGGTQAWIFKIGARLRF